MDERILITGGAGFVGANLIAHLAKHGRRNVIVLDNESLGRFGRIASTGVEFIRGDIRDAAAVARAAEGATTIVHLAADTRVMDSIADPQKNFENNVMGSFNLLQAAHRAGVRRFINASTGGAILGNAAAPIHEEIVARPISPYGASKLAIEGYCSAFAAIWGLNAISLRFSNIYGPASYHKGSVVAHFFKRILSGDELVVYGDGSQIRDYLYVGDLVQGIVQAIDSNINGVFQLASGRPTTILSLVDCIRGVVGDDRNVRVRHEPFRSGEVHTTWCDITKARRDLAFDPTTTLNSGLQTTWAWFRDEYVKA